jgi:molybdopterin-binding protein
VKLSAGNVIRGRILKVTHGAVDSEISLELAGGDRIVALVTRQSAEKLDLVEGSEAFAVIKATNVMIAVD